MSDRSPIEWTDATWNPIRARNRATGKVGWHCEHTSPGCAKCYSEAINADRLGTRLPFKPGHRADVEIYLDETVLLQPLRWRRPRKIFPCSMTDLFGPWVPDAWIDRIFAVMALCPQHTFQPLTKRSARMRAWFERPAPVYGDASDFVAVAMEDLRPAASSGAVLMLRWPLPNLWLGVSTEDQARANERVWDLIRTPAAVRIISAEPLLSGIDFTALACPTGCRPPKYCNYCYPDGKAATGTYDALATGLIDQIITGCESGRNRRECDLDDVRSIRDQCRSYGVAFFLKQLIVAGRKVGLPELDGRTWAEMPAVAA